MTEKDYDNMSIDELINLGYIIGTPTERMKARKRLYAIVPPREIPARIVAAFSRNRALQEQEHKRKEKGKTMRRAKGLVNQSRQKGSKGEFNGDDLQALYDSQKGLCWWCGKKVGDNFHIDHRISISDGGDTNPGNLVISCPECNEKKGNKKPWEFNGRLL